ncbi:MAG: UMP kinase [Patescibacteria group bacterium]
MKPKRILLKITGESLGNKNGDGIDPENVMKMAKKIKILHDAGIETAIVPGGGNLFRWKFVRDSGMARVPADQMGMMATIINGLALQDALERLGKYTRLMTTIEMPQIAEFYIVRRAKRHLEKGRIVIFAGGTGAPFFSTDSAASLKASEIEANLLAKASTIDGIYDKDPKKFSDAKFIEKISYREALDKKLAVMDLTAFTICEENKIPIMIFDANDEKSFQRLAKGENVGSIVF